MSHAFFIVQKEKEKKRKIKYKIRKMKKERKIKIVSVQASHNKFQKESHIRNLLSGPRYFLFS